MPVTNSAAVEIPSVIGFSTPIATYRRNIAGALAGFAVPSAIGFGDAVFHYRRNLAAAGTGMAVPAVVLMATPTTRVQPVRGIYSPGIQVDVIFGPHVSGDTGIEIVYSIPNRLRIRPHLIAPPSGSQHRTASPVMIWTPTVEAMYYEVHVARDINFLDRVARLDVVDSQIQKGWDFGVTYYWRVRAVAGTAWSDYSEVWSFTVPPFIEDPYIDHVSGGQSRLLNQFREDS